MNIRNKIFQFVLIGLVVSIPYSCTKDSPVMDPAVTTAIATDITSTSTMSGGIVSSAIGTDVTARGVCWSLNPSPTLADAKTTDGTGPGRFASNLQGLTPGSTYYLRAYATNKAGIIYGNQIQLVVPNPGLYLFPKTETYPAYNVTLTTADCWGITTDLGNPVVTERGLCWSALPNPTTADSKAIDGGVTGAFTPFTITGLIPNTTYYLRAYATNINGTDYGNEVSFTTDFKDIDGNVYHAVNIGAQVWMVGNLNVVHFNNGDPIPNVTNKNTWIGLNVPACSDYNNSPLLTNDYGRLYNWFAINDSRGIAPAGWHVPTYTEWVTLMNYLGGSVIAGSKLKEAGTVHWLSPNVGATNDFGFNALPGGNRSPYSGLFNNLNHSGYWWSSTFVDAINAWYISVDYLSTGAVVNSFADKREGAAIRCIRN